MDVASVTQMFGRAQNQMERLLRADLASIEYHVVCLGQAEFVTESIRAGQGFDLARIHPIADDFDSCFGFGALILQLLTHTIRERYDDAKPSYEKMLNDFSQALQRPAVEMAYRKRGIDLQIMNMQYSSGANNLGRQDGGRG
jgi:hypothetical protein